MNHVNALLNVLEILEIDKETAKKMFDHYVTEFLQLAVHENDSVTDEDYRFMQEVAMALGLSEKDFKDTLEDASEEDSYDEYDAQVDNYPKNETASSFSNYLNRWVRPEQTHDDRYLF